MIWKKSGMKKIPMLVAKSIPANTPVPMEWRLAAPAPQCAVLQQNAALFELSKRVQRNLGGDPQFVRHHVTGEGYVAWDQVKRQTRRRVTSKGLLLA